ncbi:MAG: hypothetical protein WD939_00125 [Dehalococcoidia bacterium]
MPPPDDTSAKELFAEGVRRLGKRYDAEFGMSLLGTDEGKYHDPRGSLWYALGLLLTGDDAAEPERIIRNVLSMQERRDGDPHHGNFRWLYEDEVITDLNAVEFVLEGLTHILLHARDRLSPALLAEIDGAMRLGFVEVDNLDVHWTYTNIYLLDVHNSILCGEQLGDAELLDRGLRRLRDWAERTKADGAPHEFNSGTYSGVQLTALGAIVQHAKNEQARSDALEMEELVWRHVARHFHVSTQQLAGPHSRAYRRDVVGASDFLKVVLSKVLDRPELLDGTPYYDGAGREASVHVSLTEFHCPPDARELFDRVETREVRETPSRKFGMETTTYLTPEFALGSMSLPYGVGDLPEVWPAHNSCILYFAKQREPGYGVLYCRYLVNDRRVGQFVYESSRAALDLWEEGSFRTAQRAGDAIVAYGLMARGQRHVHSLRLDVRMLGIDDDSQVVVGEQPYEGGELALEAVELIGIASGEVYIGIVPLAPTKLGHGPPLVVWQDGQELIVSLYNYRGPAKQFWEYRSLAGPFFKDNVRNGFALRVAPRSAHESLAGFLAALRKTPLSDELRGSKRAVTFGGVSLQYDLRELS